LLREFESGQAKEEAVFTRDEKREEEEEKAVFTHGSIKRRLSPRVNLS
jgi:hypothetical protein